MSHIVSTYDALLLYRGRPSVRRPVFVTETWRVISALVDFAGRDQQQQTERYIYRRRRCTISLYTMAVRSQCDFFLAVRFSSSVKLWNKDYFRKTPCDWLCGYDAAFVKLLTNESTSDIMSCY